MGLETKFCRDVRSWRSRRQHTLITWTSQCGRDHFREKFGEETGKGRKVTLPNGLPGSCLPAHHRHHMHKGANTGVKGAGGHAGRPLLERAGGYYRLLSAKLSCSLTWAAETAARALRKIPHHSHAKTQCEGFRTFSSFALALLSWWPCCCGGAASSCSLLPATVGLGF